MTRWAEEPEEDRRIVERGAVWAQRAAVAVVCVAMALAAAFFSTSGGLTP